MKLHPLCLTLAIALTLAAHAEDRGLCPPAPSASADTNKPGPPPASTPGKQYAGTVTLLTTISDKGYVCSVSVIRGIDKDTDSRTRERIAKWHFQPAKKDGHGAAAVVKIDVNYWRNANGELLSDPPPPNVD
ncbi:MAG TPA: energy transducer TonB [Candidatus Dormibacteraeota bacterium]|nr:energy transducer TonB [Candidatus Dormibacteraeota bacterium]